MNKKAPTAREVIGTYLAEQCTVIIDSEAELRAGENVIHTTRVAVRRLRSTIRVFADLFDSEQAARLEEELVWWAGLLGGVRDMDILTQRQQALLAELPAELILGPVEATIQEELAVQRKQAMDDMLEALNSERYRKFIGMAHHWRSDPPFTAAAEASADSKRLERRRTIGSPKPLRRVMLTSRLRNSSTGLAKRPNAIVMQSKLLCPYGAARPTRSFRNAKICRTCWAIIKTAL